MARGKRKRNGWWKKSKKEREEIAAKRRQSLVSTLARKRQAKETIAEALAEPVQSTPAAPAPAHFAVTVIVSKANGKEVRNESVSYSIEERDYPHARFMLDAILGKRSHMGRPVKVRS